MVGLLAIVALAGHAPNWTVPAVAVLDSITRPLSMGTFFSALAAIAGPELLDHASAIEATSLNLAVIIGPALAGALAGIIGAAPTVEVQAALTLVVAALVAVNPAFEARSAERATSLRHALRTGLRALAKERVLRATSVSSSLAGFGWGLMYVGFPLYAVQILHSPAHTSGYPWAAVAGGSILGTFVLHGPPVLRRVGLSYAILGLSACRQSYYRSVRAMCNSLFKTGQWYMPRVIAGAATPPASNIKTLEGIAFSHIYFVKARRDRTHKINKSVGYVAPKAFIDLYRKFLFYRYFVIPSAPMLVTEGITDVVYLRCAIRSRAALFPLLATTINGKHKSKIEFLRSTETSRAVLNLGNGVAGQASLIAQYDNKLKNMENYHLTIQLLLYAITMMA